MTLSRTIRAGDEGATLKTDAISARWLFGAILAAGLALRLYGVGFGLPALNDPDELMFELGAIRMLREWTLNPGWFGHPGTTTIYLLAAINVGVFLFGHLAGAFPTMQAFSDAVYADPGLIVLPGRVAMALFGTLCLWLTRRLGDALFDRRVGLAAAAILAVNPIHIEYSQIIRTDIMATCFMLLCLLAALRVARSGGAGDTVRASFWLALAVATKWPFALASLAIPGAAALRARTDVSARRRELLRTAVAAVMATGFLLLVSPFLLLDHETLLRNLKAEAQPYHVGATGSGPFANAFWYLTGPLLSGLSWPGAIFAAGGIAAMRRHREALAILAPVALAYFSVISVQTLIWERWALPLTPLLAIAAGLGFVRFSEFVRRCAAHCRAPFVLAMAAATIAPLLTEACLAARERMNDTRQMASAWLLSHAVPGQTVLIEHFAFDLVNAPFRFVFPLGEAGCVDAVALLRGKVDYETIERLRDGRSNVDFGTVAATRLESCRADYAMLAHHDRYMAESARFPAEAGNYRQLMRRGELAATFEPEPGRAGGPVVRIIRLP